MHKSQGNCLLCEKSWETANKCAANRCSSRSCRNTRTIAAGMHEQTQLKSAIKLKLLKRNYALL